MMLVFAADEGGKAIADMLQFNQTLRKLLLSSNLLGQLTVMYIVTKDYSALCFSCPPIPIR